MGWGHSFLILVLFGVVYEASAADLPQADRQYFTLKTQQRWLTRAQTASNHPITPKMLRNVFKAIKSAQKIEEPLFEAMAERSPGCKAYVHAVLVLESGILISADRYRAYGEPGGNHDASFANYFLERSQVFSWWLHKLSQIFYYGYEGGAEPKTDALLTCVSTGRGDLAQAFFKRDLALDQIWTENFGDVFAKFPLSEKENASKFASNVNTRGEVAGFLITLYPTVKALTLINGLFDLAKLGWFTRTAAWTALATGTSYVSSKFSGDDLPSVFILEEGNNHLNWEKVMTDVQAFTDATYSSDVVAAFFDMVELDSKLASKYLDNYPSLSDKEVALAAVLRDLITIQ